MTTDGEKILNTFNELYGLYDDSEEEAFDALVAKIKELGWEFEVATSNSLEWESAEIDGFSEFPVVSQKVTLTLGGCLVREWEIAYGCEYVDYTHTGTQDSWVPIRIDEQENHGLEQMVEGLGLEIPTPAVPEPKPA